MPPQAHVLAGRERVQVLVPHGQQLGVLVLRSFREDHEISLDGLRDRVLARRRSWCRREGRFTEALLASPRG